MKFVLSLCIFLNACIATTNSQIHSENGNEVIPPAGYTEYCQRNPTFVECSK